MALKFLNKKGWHTGSLRNIENVWKAEQKHEAEQKKLEELKKQIQEERERSEFRQLQEQAGLVPKQERLEFLYDSGLAVGKSSESFPLGKPEEPQKNEPESELSKLASAPGALFVEEKPASANDTWRKLHSDPLLMIRQREQESLAQIKNNPVKMEMIKKSLEAKKLKKEEKKRKKAEKKKRIKQKRQTSSASDSDTDTHDIRKKIRHDDKSKEAARGLSNGHDLKNKNDNFKEPMGRHNSNFQNPPSREHMKNSEKQVERRNITDQYRQHRSRSPSQYKERHTSISLSDHGGSMNCRQRHRSGSPSEHGEKKMSRSSQDHGVSMCHRRRNRSKSPSDYDRRHQSSSQDSRRDRLYLSSDKERNRSRSPGSRRHRLPPDHRHKSASHLRDGDNSSHATGTYAEPTQLVTSALPDTTSNTVSRPKYQAGKLSEEEKAAKLREMQIDAELHDEQRLRRLKKASEADSREAIEAARRAGKNFLDDTNKSVYGAEKGGSSTIEESVRRRTHYLQGSAAASEGNAFRR